MDEINDFFDFTKDFKRIRAPVGCVTGSVHTLGNYTEDDTKVMCKRQQYGTDYVGKAVEEECKKLNELAVYSKAATYRRSDAMSSMDDLESLCGTTECDADEDYQVNSTRMRGNDDIYKRYIFDMPRDASLPIHDKRDEILKVIKSNPVVILEGDTGCGKTTQVPQYILDDAYTNREWCNIVCTQPRRIAAVSIANRVCQERKWSLGSLVGYQIALHATASADTRLLYCTTGVLLQKLITTKTLMNYTHIILDEVHERDSDMDFLLIVVRRLLITNSKHVKIILMSATMNSSQFSNYFKICKKPAPIIQAYARRLHEVKVHYLDELKAINQKGHQINYCEPGIHYLTYLLAQKLILVIDNIEIQECCEMGQFKQASILVFLPGVNEIDEMCRILEKLNNTHNNLCKLNPVKLHALLSPDEQSKVFAPSPKGLRKVILATNIAESSITVPDVKYVIDFCLAKSLVTDTSTGFSSLQLHWVSRSNCRQRSGRAGRVMKGRAYRLVCRNFYETMMEEFGVPEMLRCPLENVVLKAKILNMGSPSDILALALSPPNLTDIQNTILRLKEAGALYTTLNNGEYSIQDGEITFMGRIMASLPLSIPLSRLIILGYMFSVLDEAIIIAAGLSVRAVFNFPTDDPQKNATACMQKLLYADGSGSDLFAILKAYRLWANMRQHSIRDQDTELKWAERYFINMRSLQEMHLLIQRIDDALSRFNIKKLNTHQQRVHWMDREKTIILKIVIAGAFYPHYFTRSNAATDRERDIYNALNGNDPFNTVMFRNFNKRYIGQLYTRCIKDLFKGMLIQPKDISVQILPGSEKVFVKFKSEPDEKTDHHLVLKVPGRVNPDVFKALRMRLSGVPAIIRVMEPHVAERYVEERGFGAMLCNYDCEVKKVSSSRIRSFVLPSLFDKYLKGRITHVENCDKFYFLPLQQNDILRKIHETMNSSSTLKTEHFSEAKCVSEGMIVAAPLFNLYYRAKVLKIANKRNRIYMQVFFIDCGLVKYIDFVELRQLPERIKYLKEMPPRVFECRLASVQPSTVKSPNGQWSEEAKDMLLNCVNGKLIEIEIYSLVQGVASVIIHAENITLNELLVQNFLARVTDENYLSKMDHDYRTRKQFCKIIDEYNRLENEQYIASMIPSDEFDIEPPSKQLCNTTLRLRGPYSPLESTIHSILRAGSWKTVHIERESVNAVLLDTDPQDTQARLIVAASISENSNDNIVIRNTTLMPNIHGIGALITMMFCPTLQVKRNANHTKYVGILAGLGYNHQTNKPLYGEHDISLILDVELDGEDFSMVNRVRYYMDCILQTAPDEHYPSLTQEQIGDCKAKIKQVLIKLLSKNRKYVEPHCDVTDKWETENPKDVFATINILGNRAIFPMLSTLYLQAETQDQLQALRLQCRELYELKNLDNIKNIRCCLCKQPLENIVQLRIHLLSQMHRDREEQIGFKAETNERA